MATNPTLTISPLERIALALRRGEIAFALGLMAILVVLILPMPKWLLDMSLAISLTFSVIILMTSLFIVTPLELSAFPTVLLIATMLRLGLNVASTRLILSDGHEGPAAAGQVIKAFGNFVMGGNFVIGVIVFSILVIVNFIVITKGSGRIAEVSARFSLDAMPGKQMAIDSDLSAGLINEEQARKRRKELEEESNFFGAMDGAAKFVRGDAIAGLLITLINVVGGVIIGVGQKGLTFSDAAHTYTLLTVGDGLISQIPALIISTAAGLLVSKSGVEGSLDKAFFEQLGAYPTALGVSSFLLAALSLLPGIPMLPFLVLSSATGFSAWKLTESRESTQRAAEQAEQELASQDTSAQDDKVIQDALHVDVIRLELGYGLLPLVNAEDGRKITDQIKALRKQLALEMGFVLPSVRLQDSLQLASNSYVMRVKEVVSGQGEVRPERLLAISPFGDLPKIQGEQTKEPTFGLPALWIDPSLRDEAEREGCTVVEPVTVIITHLTEVVKDNMADMLSYTETQKLLGELESAHQKLLTDMVPSQITYAGIQRVLQNLIGERISIRDLGTILEGISEACGFTRSVSAISEHVRMRLAKQICASFSNTEGYLCFLSLSPAWEQAFLGALVGDGDSKNLAMAPTQLQEFMNQLKQAFERFSIAGDHPVLVTSAAIRPYVRSVVERFRPQTIVMSQNEIHPKAKVKSLGQVV